MGRIGVGIDCGSAVCKGIFLKDGAVAAAFAAPVSWSPGETARAVLDELLRQGQATRAEAYVVATGYGRVAIDFADKKLTEITCHALGAEHLLPGARTVIDIGGQDSKVISVDRGRVLAFQMNDKCAAGTGRFVEMSAQRLGVDLPGFAALLQAEQSCALSSMCAVFADSELVSLLAGGKSREAVAGGVVQAVAARVVALAGRLEIQSPILLTGGLAKLEQLRAALEQRMQKPVVTSALSHFAGAIGAAQKGALM